MFGQPGALGTLFNLVLNKMECRQDEIVPFRVFVRVRPLSDKEKSVRAERILRFEENLVGLT